MPKWSCSVHKLTQPRIVACLTAAVEKKSTLFPRCHKRASKLKPCSLRYRCQHHSNTGRFKPKMKIYSSSCQKCLCFAHTMKVGGDRCSKCLLLCFTEEIKSCRFGRTWGWVNNDWILIFWVNCAFKNGCWVDQMWRSLMGYNERLWDEGGLQSNATSSNGKKEGFLPQNGTWFSNCSIQSTKLLEISDTGTAVGLKIVWLKWVTWQNALAWGQCPYVCVCVCVCVRHVCVFLCAFVFIFRGITKCTINFTNFSTYY